MAPIYKQTYKLILKKVYYMKFNMLTLGTILWEWMLVAKLSRCNEKMNFTVKQSVLTPELKKYIYKCFSNYAIFSTGIDGIENEPVSFEIIKNNELIGVVVVQLFWGQLHIKYLIVEEKYRGQGYAKKLIEHAFEYGKQQKCHFAFVETMSFQAPEFYQKLGFKIELKREGYRNGTSFYYLRKDLSGTM